MLSAAMIHCNVTGRQPTRSTSSICSGSVILSWHTDMVNYCGL